MRGGAAALNPAAQVARSRTVRPRPEPERAAARPGWRSSAERGVRAAGGTSRSGRRCTGSAAARALGAAGARRRGAQRLCPLVAAAQQPARRAAPLHGDSQPLHRGECGPAAGKRRSLRRRVSGPGARSGGCGAGGRAGSGRGGCGAGVGLAGPRLHARGGRRGVTLRSSACRRCPRERAGLRALGAAPRAVPPAGRARGGVFRRYQYSFHLGYL